ncbi:MAG: DUF503 domain-containing protein [Nitrospinae bacterium]|nr:DUF503 domain-containing protein [Nitrospinota bacterium]
MVVGMMKIALWAGHARSLKDKRQVVRSVKDRVKAKFNASVAEVEDQDLWQRITLGVTVVAADAAHADSQIQSILSFITSIADVAEVSTELVSR